MSEETGPAVGAGARKAVVVTGASSGFGNVAARALTRAEFYHRIGIADLLPEQAGR